MHSLSSWIFLGMSHGVQKRWSHQWDLSAQSPWDGELCRQDRTQGRHFRADIYTEDTPRSCSGISRDWGSTQPRPAKPTLAGRGKRLQRCEKKVIVCLYSCCTFSFAQPSPLGRCSVLPQISCPAHIIRKSTTGKGHFSKCCFPVISNPPERRVQLFPYCLFFVSSFSLKALQELLGLLQTHGIVFCFGMDRG